LQPVAWPSGSSALDRCEQGVRSDRLLFHVIIGRRQDVDREFNALLNEWAHGVHSVVRDHIEMRDELVPEMVGPTDVSRSRRWHQLVRGSEHIVSTSERDSAKVIRLRERCSPNVVGVVASDSGHVVTLAGEGSQHGQQTCAKSMTQANIVVTCIILVLSHRIPPLPPLVVNKCPRQESNLVYDLRRVACCPSHSKDLLN
jgi:hypothetical protein